MDTTPDPAGRITEAWDALEAVLPADALPGPAAPDDLTALEEALGFPLPTGLRASWERHDGIAEPHWRPGWLHSVGEILGNRSTWLELRPGQYEPAWVPLVSDGAGNHLGMDARTGELFDYDHETNEADPEPYGWAEYLERMASVLAGDDPAGLWV